MPQNKFIFITFLFFCFFIFHGNALADNTDIIINEIQLLPTEERFIELYNPTSAQINLTNYYIQRKTQNGSDFTSLVSKTYFENKIIGAYGYFLISRGSLNNADIILSSLTLTESNTIQLKKSDAEIVDKVGWGSANDCQEQCAPNPTDGQSIQLASSGVWVAATPTPKTLNITDSQNTIQQTDQQTTDTSQQATQTTSTQSNDQQSTISNPLNSNHYILNSIQADAGENIIALLGQEITFDASKSQGASIYEWNLGDGSTAKDKIAKHKYGFPGKYIITLTISNGESESQDQITASIYPSGVYISEFLPSPAGSDDNEWIEIYNSNDFPVDMSEWKLDDEPASAKATAGKENKFIIPQNTFIAAKNYLVFPRSATKIALNNDKDSVRFYYPEGIAIDEIKYEKSKENYSAARKQDGGFVWTKNITPGAPNIFLSESVSYQNNSGQNQAVSADLSAGKTMNLTSGGRKYTVINAGNFLAKNLVSAANAQTVAEEEPIQPIQNGENGINPKSAMENKNNSGNISANISESIKDKKSKNMISRIILTLFTLAIFAMMWQVFKKN